MTTNKEHNQSLLNALSKTIEEIEIKKICLDNAKKDDPIVFWHETDLWLAEQRKETIEKALINQDLDNW